MHWINYTLLIISGLSAGAITAAAYVAFIAMLGIFPKFAEKTKTAHECMLYESCLFLGVLTSTFLQFFASYTSAGLGESLLPPTVIGNGILILIGLFGGIYIGFLIGGLSEILNVIPIYARITHIGQKIGYIIFFIALGKGISTLLQFWVLDA